jgi:hypothetical protein
LGELIRRYNAAISDVDSSLAVDRTVVDLRDALAHGRLLAATPRRPVRLFRFSKPESGQVEVLLAVDLTDKWFSRQRRRLYLELQKVSKASDFARRT